MFVENRYNIQSPNFLDILNRESRLRDCLHRAEIGTRYWNSLWDQLDRVLISKHRYEDKVVASRMQKGQDVYGGRGW